MVKTIKAGIRNSNAEAIRHRPIKNETPRILQNRENPAPTSWPKRAGVPLSDWRTPKVSAPERMNANTTPTRLIAIRMISLRALLPGGPRRSVETSIGECRMSDTPAKLRKFLFHTEKVRVITEPTVNCVAGDPKARSAGSAMAIGDEEIGKASTTPGGDSICESSRSTPAWHVGDQKSLGSRGPASSVGAESLVVASG